MPTSIPVENEDGSISWVDGDTFKIDRQNYRLPDVNAPEKGRLWDVGGGKVMFSPGQDTGERTLIQQLSKVMGTTEPAPTGDMNQGRIVADLVNPETGASLTETAVKVGILNPNQNTPDSALAARRLSNAATALLGGPVGEAEKLGQEARQRREDAGISQFLKGNADDEAQFAAFKKLTGVKALQDATREAARIQNILDTGGDAFGKFMGIELSPETRKNLEDQLAALKNNIIFAATYNDMVGGVNKRHHDRSLTNQSYNQTTDSLLRATYDSISGVVSMLDAVAEPNKWEGLSNWAKRVSGDWKYKANSLPETLSLTAAKDALTDGQIKFRDITNTGQAVVNGLASSVPSFVSMLGGGMLGGPVGALAAPWVIYAGQNYRDQEDDKKNAPLALTYGAGMALLDRLGLEGLVGFKPGMIFKAGEFDKIVSALQVAKGISKEAAEASVNMESKKLLLEMAEGGAEMARRQWRSKEAVLHSLGGISLAAAGEGLTESMQTILGELATSGDAFDLDVRYNTGFWDKLSESLMAGAAVGGTLHTAKVGIEAKRWNVLEDYETLGRLTQTEGNKVREALRQLSPNQSVNIRDYVKNISPNPKKNLLDMDGLGGTPEKVKAALMSPLSFLRHLGTTTIPTVIGPHGEVQLQKAILKSMMQPGTLAGDSFDGLQQALVSVWTTPDKETMATMLGVSPQKADRMLRDAYKDFWSKKLPSGNETLDSWWNSLQSSGNSMYQAIEDAGADPLLWLTDPDQIFTGGSFDSRSLGNHQGELHHWLLNKNKSAAEADQAIDYLLSGDPSKVQSVVDSVLKPLGAFVDPKLNHIFNTTVFDSFENYKHRVAKGVAKEVMLGAEGGKLATQLEKIEAAREFNSPEEKRFITQQVQDWYRIINNDYYSMKETPNLEKTLSWAATFAMLAYLGKAAFSSIPELAFSMLGVPAESLIKQIKSFGHELGRNLGDEINRATKHTLGGTTTGRIRAELKKINIALEKAVTAGDAQKIKLLESERDSLVAKEQARLLHQRLAYNDSGYNTQARYDISGAKARRVLDVFARMIGLVAQTDATRMARLSVASDTIRTELMNLQRIAPADRRAVFSGAKELTKSQMESYSVLAAFGMDVELFLDTLDKLNLKTDGEFNQLISNFSLSNDVMPDSVRMTAGLSKLQMREFTTNLATTMQNFVDQRVANPQTSNMPKFMQNPRLRPLTIMLRFIATFQADVLPRLWVQYIKNGNGGMRWSAFTVIATSLMLGAMANTMKDLLSYGDDDNPYIKSNRKIAQRALYASGLLGQAQGLVDRVIPLYDFNKKDDDKGLTPAKAWQFAKGESPMLSWGDNVVRGAFGIASADDEKELTKGVRTLSRSAPLIGSFPIVGKELEEMIKK